MKNIFKNLVSNFSFVKRMKLKPLLIVVLIVLAVGGIVVSGYYYRQYQVLKVGSSAKEQEAVKVLVAAVSRLMELPADEIPTMATVLDKEKLRDQLFFAKAENGDKLLAYTKEGKAVLYRPSANKIINVAPIIINQQEGAGQNKKSSQSSSKLKIAYYNGTEIAGLSGRAEKTVRDAHPDYQTSILTDAAKQNYTETLVVDLAGIYREESDDLTRLLSGKISPLPSGEVKPDADILVILGK